MSDADETAPTEWAKYLREVTGRDGWSVARLARDADLDRTTIFRWLKGGGDRITIDSVRRVAEAVGDPIDRALRAAAGLDIDEGPADEIEFEISMIEQSDLPASVKRSMITHLRGLQARHQADRVQLRERQRTDRRAQLQALLEAAHGGHPAT